MDSLQDRVRHFQEAHGLELPAAQAVVDCMAELGEVSRALLRISDYGRRDNWQASAELVEEMGDLLYALIGLANACHVDLEEALEAALLKYEQRLRDWGDAGSRR